MNDTTRPSEPAVNEAELRKLAEDAVRIAEATNPALLRDDPAYRLAYEYLRILDEAVPQVEILNLFGDITKQLGGVPCNGHLDFAAGTWTYHRERECGVVTPPTDEARLNDRPWSGEPTEPTPLPDETPFSIDEARAGEPRTEAVEQLADFILGKIESPEYQGLHPELASMGLAIAIHEREAAAAPSLDVERLAEVFRKHPIHWDVKQGTGTGTRYVMTRVFDSPDEAAAYVMNELGE